MSLGRLDSPCPGRRRSTEAATFQRVFRSFPYLGSKSMGTFCQQSGCSELGPQQFGISTSPIGVFLTKPLIRTMSPSKAMQASTSSSRPRRDIAAHVVGSGEWGWVIASLSPPAARNHEATRKPYHHCAKNTKKPERKREFRSPM